MADPKGLNADESEILKSLTCLGLVSTVSSCAAETIVAAERS